MATLKSKQSLAAVLRESPEEHPRNGHSPNTPILRINEEYVTQVSEEIEGKVNKKLSQDLNSTESCFLGALFKLYEFLLNPQLRTHSETVPEISQSTDVENKAPTWDRSQNDHHPEMESSVYQSHHSIDSDPDEASHSKIN